MCTAHPVGRQMIKVTKTTVLISLAKERENENAIKSAHVQSLL